MWWFQEGVCVLPVALVLWSSATFIFAYITAVLLRHVDPLVPYISDTGTLAPERCVFGIMLDVSAFLGAATMYVRYKQLQALTGDAEPRLTRLNRLGLVLGCCSSLGLCVVANFQKTALFAVHVLGAALALGVGALYVLVQTVISYHTQPLLHAKLVFWTRLALTVWTFSSITSMFVSSVLMYLSLPGVDIMKKLHWTPGEPGYTPHIISSVSEWSLALSFISFFLTYIRDFKKINLRAEAELHSQHLYDHPPTALVQSETSPLLAGGI